jgi:hypothetical protein
MYSATVESAIFPPIGGGREGRARLAVPLQLASRCPLEFLTRVLNTALYVTTSCPNVVDIGKFSHLTHSDHLASRLTGAIHPSH